MEQVINGENIVSIRSRLRIVPNGFARSALFNVKNKKAPRKYLENVSINSSSGISILYKGYELRQDDADVFLTAIHLLRTNMATQSRYSSEIKFTAIDFIKLMGWPYRTAYVKKLKKIMNRLKETTLTYPEKLGQSVISIFSYIHYPESDRGKLEYCVRVEKDIFRLFSDNFTRISLEIRSKLKPLAKWLYSFYSSHQEAFPHKVSTLKSYCGSDYDNIRFFKALLKKSLDELVAAGFLYSYNIDNTDKVHVRRSDVIKNSNDDYFSKDLLNILVMIIKNHTKSHIKLADIKKLFVDDCNMSEFVVLLNRSLDQLVKLNFITSYTIQNSLGDYSKSTVIFYGRDKEVCNA